MKTMDSPFHGKLAAGVQQLNLAAVQARADEGDADAQYTLGVFHHRLSLDPSRGGKVESLIQAYLWLHRAAVQGHKDSLAAWERVTMSMTRPDIAEANRRASAFAPRPAAAPQDP